LGALAGTQANNDCRITSLAACGGLDLMLDGRAIVSPELSISGRQRAGTYLKKRPDDPGRFLNGLF